MIDFSLARLQPAAAAVYAALGLKNGSEPSARSAALLPRAMDLFLATSEPRGMSRPVTADEFAAIFAGQGLNAPQAPLEEIFPQARRLELFAFTLGERISAEIERLFSGVDFALGFILDAVASLAADNAGRLAEEWLESQFGRQEESDSPPRAYLYSPGYCGWHISSQERLFAALRPQAIGLSLNASFLMAPLKSISGVLAVGPTVIHRIAGGYPFCSRCQSPACRERDIGIKE
ncbi:MAG: hypothetical protein MUC72_02625 [Acidobacteria bacterium]|jgi:hypothetical protein|nr:hypothetical protein [Acidobacteriota bacterium]